MYHLSSSSNRVCLLRVKYWGEHADLANALDEAYLHFRSWCKTSRIPTTQPPFKTWMVLRCVNLFILIERFFFKSFTASFLPLELFEHLAEIFKKPNGTQICFTAKAYNGRVLSQWLADCLRDAISKHYHDDHEQLPLLASCMFLGLKVSSTSTCIFK